MELVFIATGVTGDGNEGADEVSDSLVARVEKKHGNDPASNNSTERPRSSIRIRVKFAWTLWCGFSRA
jgi:hypothetical protein